MSIVNKAVIAAMPLVPKPIIKAFANRYIAGVKREEALELIKQFNSRQIVATCDLLGESTSSPEYAKNCTTEYIALLEDIDRLKLDANVSVKLTQLGLLINPEMTFDLVSQIVSRAKDFGNFVRIDMEDSNVTTKTLDFYRRMHKDHDNVGCVIQAYLHRSAEDVDSLIAEGTNIRLCKGIYVEPKSIAYKNYTSVNNNFKFLIKKMLKTGNYVGIATHDEIIYQAAMQMINKYKIAKSKYEFQMLLGVDNVLLNVIRDQGHKIRVYVPYGQAWYAYSRRRFKENPQMLNHIIKNLFHPYERF